MYIFFDKVGNFKKSLRDTPAIKLESYSTSMIF